MAVEGGEPLLAADRQIVAQQRADADADAGAIVAEAFVDAEPPGEAAEGQDDVLADAVLVRAALAVMPADAAIAEAQFDMRVRLVAQQRADFGLVQAVLVIAQPADLFDGQAEFFRQRDDAVQLPPRLRIMDRLGGGGQCGEQQRRSDQGARADQ